MGRDRDGLGGGRLGWVGVSGGWGWGFRGGSWGGRWGGGRWGFRWGFRWGGRWGFSWGGRSGFSWGGRWGFRGVGRGCWGRGEWRGGGGSWGWGGWGFLVWRPGAEFGEGVGDFVVFDGGGLEGVCDSGVRGIAREDGPRAIACGDGDGFGGGFGLGEAGDGVDGGVPGGGIERVGGDGGLVVEWGGGGGEFGGEGGEELLALVWVAEDAVEALVGAEEGEDEPGAWPEGGFGWVYLDAVVDGGDRVDATGEPGLDAEVVAEDFFGTCLFGGGGDGAGEGGFLAVEGGADRGEHPVVGGVGEGFACGLVEFGFDVGQVDQAAEQPEQEHDDDSGLDIFLHGPESVLDRGGGSMRMRGWVAVRGWWVGNFPGWAESA